MTQEEREVEQEQRNDSTDVLFIYTSSLAFFSPLIILSPAKKKKNKGEHGLYFSVSANVMCRSVTEAVHFQPEFRFHLLSLVLCYGAELQMEAI